MHHAVFSGLNYLLMYRLFIYAILLWSMGFSLPLAAQRTTMADFSLAYNLGAYNRAAVLGEELLLRKSTQNNVHQWFPLTVKLGLAYHYLGNYTRGLERLESAIQWAKEEEDYPMYELLVAHTEKGKILRELGREVEAKWSFEEVLTLVEGQSLQHKNSSILALYLDALMGTGYVTYAKENYTQAKGYFAKVLQYSKVDIAPALLAQATLYMGKIAEKLNQPSQAGEYMFAAIKMGEMESIEQSVAWSTFYKDLGGYYMEYKRMEEALKYNNLAIQSLLPAWKGAATGALPMLEELNQAASLGLMAELLAQRGTIYLGTSQWELALGNYRLMDDFVTALRRLYTGERARLLWSDRALDFYEKAIQTCLKLSDLKGDNSYQKEAFVFSERSKSLLLLEAFKKIKAKKISGVPQEKIQQEEHLEKAVDELENQLFLLKQNRRKTEAYKKELIAKEKALFKKRQMYEDFLVELRKQYPAYYKLKYDRSVSSVEAVQERLAKDQLLVEYFIGKKSLIVFKIQKQDYDVMVLPLAFDLSKTIKRFRQSIYGYYLNPQERSTAVKQEYLKDYKELGHLLYTSLLEPVLKQVKEDRLMIIPAGNLGFLPFEALLTQAVKDQNLKEMPYLLNNYAIGYCYSATLLHEMQLKEHIPTKIFLGFAPEFKSAVTFEGKYTFSPLKHSQKEVTEIFDIVEMNGAVFDGSNATKENFQENCEDYCIVHIATHGLMNAQSSEHSFLAFSEVPDSNDNELLYVRDLYNMHLTASLVVLSACETGVGELYESEGIASLARGFSYAGAKSLVTSLWSVNDHATAVIMRQLYENLTMGMPKDQALQKAKYDFVHKAKKPALAHPFLWSAFIQIGDEAPLPSPSESSEKGSYWWWGMLLLLGGLALFWGIKKSKG